MKIKKIIFSLGLTLGLLHAEVGTLSRIVDGDTVYFNSVKCRLAYIDTPESKKNSRLKRILNNCNGVTQSFMLDAGRESSKFLSKHMEVGKKYKYNILGKDERHSRYICEIFVNEKLINLKLVEEGYAVPYYKYIKDSKNQRNFRKAIKNAKQDKKGLFATHRSVMSCLDK